MNVDTLELVELVDEGRLVELWLECQLEGMVNDERWTMDVEDWRTMDDEVGRRTLYWSQTTDSLLKLDDGHPWVKSVYVLEKWLEV